MTNKKKDFSVGLEEELFLVDKKAIKLIDSWPKEFEQRCQEHYPQNIIHEYLTSQLEIVTPPAENISELSESLQTLRSFCAREASQCDLALMACSTLPDGLWQEAEHTDLPRYQTLHQSLKAASSRMLVSGMHVHVGIECVEKRLRLLNEITHYLPLVLALSSSSPFWSGLDSGHMSYRLSVISGLPRSGCPPFFESYQDYQDYLNCLIHNKFISNASEIWWDARLNARFPTVEIRISDTCTKFQNGIAIAAFILCLSRYLLLERSSLSKQRLSEQTLLFAENYWQARRFGLNEALFIGQLDGEKKTFSFLLEEMISQLLPHARELSCEEALLDCYAILENGTSADQQRSVFYQALEEHGNAKKALASVKMFLLSETLIGLN